MIKIYTDAAFRPQTKAGGLGIIIEHQKLFQYKYCLSQAPDNHYLEFLAMDQALKILAENEWQDSIISYFSDSQLVIDSLHKNYVKDERYQPILNQILARIETYPLFLSQWIPEKQNRGADQLARQALNQQGKFIVLA